jgi:hypothetical protein
MPDTTSMNPDERLFAFLRPSDLAPVACDLRFNGVAFGWEVLFRAGGRLIVSQSGFISRAAAVAWAHEEWLQPRTPHPGDMGQRRQSWFR